MAGPARSGSTGLRSVRRSLALILALVSLVLQLNAPVHAAVMLTADQGSVLCAEHQGAGSDQKAPADRQPSCAACIACAVAAPVLSAASRIEPVRYAEPLDPRLDILLPAPTGPPVTPPKARGPPTIA